MGYRWLIRLIAFTPMVYSKQHQVEAGRHFGDGHQRKTDVLKDRAPFGKDETRKIEAYPDRRSKDAQRGQNSWNVVRLEKQIKEKKCAQAEKNTADVLHHG